MGMFTSLKQMKAMVAEAPQMVANANELAAATQGMAQQSAFGVPQAPTVESTAATAVGPDFEPIAGVSMEAYAAVCREVAAAGYDQSRAVPLAAARGIAAADWEAAVAGWQARMQQNLAVGQRFNALYMDRH
jgi:hypothetical protein